MPESPPTRCDKESQMAPRKRDAVRFQRSYSKELRGEVLPAPSAAGTSVVPPAMVVVPQGSAHLPELRAVARTVEVGTTDVLAVTDADVPLLARVLSERCAERDKQRRELRADVASALVRLREAE